MRSLFSEEDEEEEEEEDKDKVEEEEEEEEEECSTEKKLRLCPGHPPKQLFPTTPFFGEVLPRGVDVLCVLFARVSGWRLLFSPCFFPT